MLEVSIFIVCPKCKHKTEIKEDVLDKLENYTCYSCAYSFYIASDCMDIKRAITSIKENIRHIKKASLVFEIRKNTVIIEQ